MSLFYRASAWYEAAIVLYKGSSLADYAIADVRVVRGRRIANFKTESFEIPAKGIYFVAFYAGSYDVNGDGFTAASLTFGEVRVPFGTALE